jgi:phosphoribosylanthranilate isomerase
MKPKIKICGITNKDDALLAAQLGANFIGFIFYDKSPRYISYTTAQDIKTALKEHYPLCKTVGVVVHPKDKDLKAIEGIVDIIQYSGDEDSHDCKTQLDYWKVIHIKDKDSLQNTKKHPHVSTFVFDTHKAGLYGGTGTSFDFTITPHDQSYHSILAGGLNPNNIKKAIQQAQPWGVDVCSGVEERPGVKSKEKMSEFFKEIRK